MLLVTEDTSAYLDCVGVQLGCTLVTFIVAVNLYAHPKRSRYLLMRVTRSQNAAKKFFYVVR